MPHSIKCNVDRITWQINKEGNEPKRNFNDEKFYDKSAGSENSPIKKLGSYDPDTYRTHKLIKPSEL
ncbi:CLUMA_CG012743, isoform A [Clunio marinus]|uniref:CLUMA_CG012743, isoform A n=1 Tax=Clunio marinus TaxID=568069 RepID=A0A1J1IGT4_9DIPT|nr:CLUMA_CG012743, isoform A [Clunio marinus]